MKTHHFDRHSLGLLCLPTLLPPLGVSAALFDRVVETKYGPVQGIAAFSSAPAGNISGWQNVGVWKGVPYAATTAGANRWRPPQDPVSWTETLDTSVFGPACPESQGDSATVSEDCLNLNIWSNANSTDDKLPVIIWSHPAGSAGSDALFDGGGMAAKGVVFVTINYRDGAFGWLAHPQLSAEMYDETGSNSSGNWGMLDQFAALKWIQANIAAFGGDPEFITTAGQSAGSAAAYHMVNSLLVKGIPKRAIAESGVRDTRDPEAGSLAESYNNQTTAYALGEAFLTANGATRITELRAIPLAELNDTASAPGSGGGFRATLDYYAIPATYATSLSRPPVNDIPFITRNTKDESGASTTTNLTVAQYVADMQAQYGPFNLSAAALDLYPAVNASQADASYNRHWQDTSRVSSWGYARGWYLGGAKSPIYTYFWDHAPPGQTQGAYHESEINYVLNNLYATDKPWEALDYAIAAKMSAYWANFAATGDPNLGGYYYSGDGNDDGEPLVTWNPTLGNETITMRLGDGWAPIPIAEPAQIAFLDEYFSEQIPY